MNSWLSHYKYDPIKPLIESRDEAIVSFLNRNLIQNNVAPIERSIGKMNYKITIKFL